MTATASPVTRTSQPALLGLGWRAALVLLAAAAVATALPPWVRTPLSAAAALVVGAFFVARCRRRGLLDAVLTAVGGAVVALALLGLLLNALPWRLTAVSWGVGTGALELVALAALALGRPPVRRRSARRPTRATIGWAIAVAATLAAALLLSIASFGTTHVAPLAMAISTSGSRTVLTVSAGRAQGPFELDLLTSRGRTLLARGLRPGPDGAATVRLTAPAATRGLVQLVPAGGSDPVRELILDTTKAPR